MKRIRRKYDILGKVFSVEGTPVKTGVFSCVIDNKTAYILSETGVGEFTAAAVIGTEAGEEKLVLVPAELYGKEACYECNIVHALGELFSENDRLFPKFEKTSGAVMYTEKEGERSYLLIKNERGHIGFPKGHIEYGETELMNAKREVFEETGLPFSPAEGFRREYTFTTLEDTIKTGVFFLSHYDYRPPKIQQEEVLEDWLLPYEKALELLNFPQDREILRAAEAFLTR